jgi:hypothetical protein
MRGIDPRVSTAHRIPPGSACGGLRIVLANEGLQFDQVVESLALPGDPQRRLSAGFRGRQFVIRAPAVEPFGDPIVGNARLTPVRVLDRGADPFELPPLDVQVLSQCFLGQLGPRSPGCTCQLVQRRKEFRAETHSEFAWCGHDLSPAQELSADCGRSSFSVQVGL